MTRRSSRKMSLALLAALCMLLLSACITSNSGNTTTSTSSISAGPIKIGVSLSLTGDQSADGQATQQGYDTWMQYVNSHGGILGHQVKMIYYDDATKLDQTRANFEKLITVDKVNFVIGPFNDPQTIQAAEVAHQHNMFLLDCIGTGVDVFQKVTQEGLTNLFAVSLAATGYFKSFVNYILSLPQNLRPATVSYATSDDGFTKPQIDSVRPLLEQGGIKTASYQVYSAENADPVAFAQKVVAAHADIVVLGTIGTQDNSTFIKTFIQQHYNPKLIISSAGPDQGQSFIQAIGAKNTEGLLVPNDGWWSQAKNYQNSDFVSLITSKYKITPDAISSDSVQAFSAGQVLQQAIEQAKTLDNQKIMQVLKAGTFQSLQGPVGFAQDGENKLSVPYLFQWQNGNLIPVFPQAQAQANLEYPRPAWSS